MRREKTILICVFSLIFFFLLLIESRADIFNDMLMFYMVNENNKRYDNQKKEEDIYNKTYPSRNHEYVCAYCGESRTETHEPDKDGCPNQPFHSWWDVGSSGNYGYSCKRCSAVVFTTSKPNTASCYGGNVSGNHEWIEIKQ